MQGQSRQGARPSRATQSWKEADAGAGAWRPVSLGGYWLHFMCFAVVALVVAWAGAAFAEDAVGREASGNSDPGAVSMDADTSPQLRFFGAEQGINRQINDIVLGRYGDLWLGTMDGLARYDGRGFRFWRREAGASESLPDNSVAALHVDAAGTLWAATWTGLVTMDTRKQRMRRVRAVGANAACLEQITVMDSLEGTLWMVTTGGLVCARRPDGALHVVRLQHLPDDGTELFSPTAFLVESADRLLLGGEYGLVRLHLRPGGTEADVERLTSSATTDLGRDPDGSIWVGHADGLVRIGVDGGFAPSPWQLPDKGAMSAVLSRQDGSYWIIASRALYRRDSQGDASRSPALLP